MDPADIVSPPLPAGEGVSASAAEKHPTADEVTTLINTARAANVDLETFGHDMRRLMQLPESQKITKKFLRETMTISQYNTARAHYGEVLRQIIEEDVPNHEPPSETREASASESVREATVEPPIGESTPAGPSASSSAPASVHADINATERDRQRLRAEVAAWQLRISAQEIEYVIVHNPYSKARGLLWKARVVAPPASPIKAAAD
jgi:hypothetical protein